jgi:hypothetical protein
MSFPQMILTLFLSAGMFELPVKEKWVVEKDGYLRIEGSTNVNTFNCSVQNYAAPDTLTFFSGVEQYVPMTGRLSLPVSSIDCLNRIMNSDLRKTLKAKEHPALNIHFLSLSRYPCLKRTAESVSGMVYIELAGAAKKFEINYKVWLDDRQVVHLVGDQQIRFSDFGLASPKRMGGVVRANDVLDVEFHVSCRVVGKVAK